MRNARIALLTVLVLPLVPAPAGAQSRIVGGSAATQGEYPAQAYVQAAAFGCGGTLISRTKVVTAAHCVDAANYALPIVPLPLPVAPGLVTVYLGSNTAASGDEHAVSAVTIHPDYDPLSSANDIAVLTLTEPATQAALPLVDPQTDAAAYAVGRPATVIGWGTTTEGGDASDELLEVEVPIVSDEDCDDENSYGGTLVPEVMLCAGLAQGGKDSCQGDSGGPLMVAASGTPKLVGVVSFGDGCARADKYGVYTEVPAPAVRGFLVEEVGAPPTAAVDAVTGAVAGTATALRATATDPTPGGGVASVVWDLDGDGVFADASGADVTWSPSAAGDRPVRVRVTDADGMVAVAERVVTVAPAGATPPGTPAPGAPTPPAAPAATPATAAPPAAAPAPSATRPRARLTRVSAKGSRGSLRVRGTVSGTRCTGARVRVTVTRGGRRVGRTLTRVASGCTFATSLRIRGRLKVAIELVAVDGSVTRLATRTRRVR